MISPTFQEYILRHFRAIELCLSHRLPLQALMLIYVGIDSMAWLAMPAGQEDVTGADFMMWYEKYFPATTTAVIRGVDLYAARCGVVHSATAESRLARNASANRIAYTWGSGNPRLLEAGIVLAAGRSEFSKYAQSKVLHVDTLFGYFKDALHAFDRALAGDTELCERVIARAKELFAYADENFERESIANT
jgi:hypothetical protein